MFCFSRLLSCQILLAFTVPLLAQQSPPTDVPAFPRVPPPSADASVEELEHQGDILRGQKAYLDAIDYYRAAIKKADSAILHNKVGISLFQLHRDKEARKQYEFAVKLDKLYPEPYNNLGALYDTNGRYGPAIKEYKKAIQLSESNASFHSNLGTAYFHMRDFDAAIKEYTRALALDPDIFERQQSGGVSVKLISSSDLGHLYYVMAQMYGGRGDSEHCRHYLSKANEEGYPIRDALHDDQFAGLRKDPGFVAFVRSLKPPPAASSE